MKRRQFLGGVLASAAATAIAPHLASAAPWQFPFGGGTATWKQRLTGADMPTNSRWKIAGTDLAIPYAIDGFASVGYLFGDTFNTPFPEGPPLPNDWRSPVGLRSTSQPGNGIVFDSAYGVAGDGRAPEIMHNGHNAEGEVTVIPTDGFTDGGTHYMSYMSIQSWNVQGAQWRTNYAGIGVSNDGNSFQRTGYRNPNNGNNTDPFQMWSMQKEGDYVYIVSVRAGRQNGPMMLRRCHPGDILDGNAHELWSGKWSRDPCTPILNGNFGEPSLRKLGDTWVLAYLTSGNIVTRTAPRPEGPWSGQKTQVTQAQESNCYGGFIHPWSTTGNLQLMVSTWKRGFDGKSTAYHVSRFQGAA